VFVVRASDSGSDVILDFVDGQDAIGLASDISFDDLTIAQGDGVSVSSDHTTITYSGNTKLVIENIISSNITALDFASTSTSSLTLTGDNTNNTLIGGAGNDTVSTGDGADFVVTWGGDDTITVDGTGDKTINGGSGTDEIIINLANHSSIKDFEVSYSVSSFSFVDKSGNTISLSNFEDYTIGSNSYVQWDDQAINSGDGGARNAFWGETEKLLYGYSGAVFYAQKLTGSSSFTGMSASDDLEFIGDPGQQTLNLNIDRASYTGTFNISLGDGNDFVHSARFTNADSLDAGAGDDKVYVMVGGGQGTPAFSSFSMAKLDGGDGVDTLAFEESTTGGATLTLTTGGAVNFENLIGTSQAETLNGDSNANTLEGKGGADVLNGGGGNDRLFADNDWDLNPMDNEAGYSDDDDQLYGGAGDDLLVANAGDNILDGGDGSDTLMGGNGSDVFVVRASDSGSDVILDFTTNDQLGLVDGLGTGDISTQVINGNTEVYAGGQLLVTLDSYTSSLVSGDDYIEYTLII